MSKIAAILSFCTNDLRFLDKCISGVRPFSSQIIIPVCDHFYNGEKEDLELLKQIYSKYPDIDFVEFSYSEKEVYGTPSQIEPYSFGWAEHWHQSARLIGTYFLKNEIDYVLFCDVDEIFSGNLKEIPYTQYDALRLATYWYFKTAENAATVYPDGPLLVKREKLNPDLLIEPDERMGLFQNIQGKKEREYLYQEKPMVHHYSWVRTREEMRKKVRTWGHHWERDWEKLLEESSGDFVRGYTYKKVPAFWDPLKEQVLLPVAQNIKNVSYVNPKDVFRMEIKMRSLS